MADNYDVVVIASPNELKLIPEYVKDSRYSIIITGIGYGNVFNALKDLPRDTKIINIGYAGSNRLAIGSSYEITWSYNYHPNVEYDEPKYKCQTNTKTGVPCYSSSDFVLQTNIKEPCVFDMELYAINAMGFTDVRAIKVVSDNLNYKEYENNSGN